MSLLDRSRAWSLMLAWCLVLQLVTTVACGAPPVTEEALAQRRKEIASRPDAKRQELVRKYDQYQRLSVDERHKLQDLHDVIEAEPDLKKVMEKYSEWLKNLDLTQREQLRQAKTPEQKRNLVVKFHAAQVKRNDEVWREMNPQPEKQRLPIIPLNSDELQKVMTAWETALVKEGILDQKTAGVLDKTQGTQRYKLLVRAIGDYYHPENGRPREFEIPKEVKAAFEAISRRGEGRQRLNDLWRQGNQAHHQRNIVFAILRLSTVEEARREFHGPEGEKLKETLFNSLPAEAQAKFSQVSPERHDPFLMNIHLEEIRREFSRAGDLPKWSPGEGNPRERGGDFFKQYNGDDNKRQPPGRKPDKPPENRGPKKDSGR